MKEIKLQIETVLKLKVVDSKKIKVVAPKGSKDILHVFFLRVFGDATTVKKNLLNMGYNPSEIKYDAKKKANYYEIKINENQN